MSSSLSGCAQNEKLLRGDGGGTTVSDTVVLRCSFASSVSTILTMSS